MRRGATLSKRRFPIEEHGGRQASCRPQAATRRSPRQLSVTLSSASTRPSSKSATAPCAVRGPDGRRRVDAPRTATSESGSSSAAVTFSRGRRSGVVRGERQRNAFARVARRAQVRRCSAVRSSLNSGAARDRQRGGLERERGRLLRRDMRARATICVPSRSGASMRTR